MIERHQYRSAGNMSQDTAPYKTRLLLLGAVIGALLATTGILEPSAPADGDLIASVDGEPILKSDYLEFLNQMSQERREPLARADRERVLNRLVEEKLLISRGIELGLPWEDGAVRKAIARAMIDTVVSEAGTSIPSDAELATFYQRNKAYFRGEPRLRVQVMQFRGDSAAARAAQAHRQLEQQGSWSELADELADPPLPPVPSSLLPASRLAGYLGNQLQELALELPVGDYSEPVESGGVVSIVRVLGREETAPPALDLIHERVLAEYQRRASDEALRHYLAELRNSADVVIDQAFLEQLDALEAPPK